MDDFDVFGRTRSCSFSSASSSIPASTRRGSVGSCSDRFIPARRRKSDMDAAYYRITSPITQTGQTPSPFSSAQGFNSNSSKSRKKSTPAGNLARRLSEDRILVFSPDAARSTPQDPVANLLHRFDNLSAGCCSPNQSQSPKNNRPVSPDRILGMPTLEDNVHSNVLDWSSRNNIAVGLVDEVYSWNVETGAYQMAPVQTSVGGPSIHCVAWDPTGDQLAMGTADGQIRVWKLDKGEVYQLGSDEEPTTCPHKGAMTAVVWCPLMAPGRTLISGQMCGCIVQYDLRTHGGNLMPYSQGHTKAVCGLTTSSDGRYMASAGKDQVVNIWCVRQRTLLRSIKAHTGPIKGVAWCPWQSNMVASAGGVGDGFIRCWNINSGLNLAEIDTQSEVYSLAWSEVTHNLVSGHGGGHNNIIRWRYPNMDVVGTLKGHKGRVLHMTFSPDGRALVSGGADEVLMIWKGFDPPDRPARRGSAVELGMSLLSRTIR